MKNKQFFNALARRQFGRLALGGAAALALAACGGGGGDGSDSDSQRSLLDVYNKLEEGMGPDEVTAMVGRTADSSAGGSRAWHNGDESLSLNFMHKQGTQISGAHWYIGSSQSLAKSFKEV